MKRKASAHAASSMMNPQSQPRCCTIEPMAMLARMAVPKKYPKNPVSPAAVSRRAFLGCEVEGLYADQHHGAVDQESDGDQRYVIQQYVVHVFQ